MAHDILGRLAKRGYSPFTSEVRTVPSPAVGTDFAITVNAGQVWNVRAVKARLVTSAAVANRTPALVVDDQTNRVCVLPVLSVITAGLTTDITWLADYGAGPTAIVGNAVVAPMPELPLQAGWRLLSLTGAIDVADQFSQVTVWIDRMDSPSTTINRELGIPVDALIEFLQAQSQGES